MAAGDDTPRPISLFYSYSHRDEDLRQKLQEHLAVLRWDERIAEWHDRNIDAGDDWAKAIDDNLKSADIVLLLVSASFLASPYCWGKEMSTALERNARGEATVIPVILKPCQWRQTRLKDLQAAPTDGRAATLWPNLDEAFDDVAAKIVHVVDELRRKRDAARPHPAPLPQAGEGGTRGSGRVRAFKDLEVFRDIDAPWCPEMVVIPSGTFLMGSPPDEEGRYDNEGPQHRVTIGSRFALGKYAVRFSEYDHFCEVTKREKPEDQDWGRGQRPVINVSWLDAVAYCEWLTKETGQPYRLPSEGEWEYGARAGTTTPFSFGGTISPKQANYDGNYTYGGGSKGEYRQRTVPVGTLPANPWGLHEMHGNVWEWVEDVWHDSYAGAPADGSAWTDGEGKDSSRLRVDRGGSWHLIPRYLRSAYRGGGVPDGRGVSLGFRLARTLD
ncbi:MAG: SUMF1/EgtB/PvdO family nonheme iron enzyme [Rhodospirillales bacterium]|nr:SUMF1/EgtB/PvdO family nonheme iron enzyme [Rhodospirillales bacterium]